MSFEGSLLVATIIVGGVVLLWYLYERSKIDDTSEDTDPKPDDANTDDDAYEDLLFTGVMLSEVYDDDDDASDDMDADEFDSMNDGSGYDDGGTLE